VTKLHKSLPLTQSESGPGPKFINQAWELGG